MWRPGAPKPVVAAEAIGATTKSTKSITTTAKSQSDSAKKKLSGSTMNMRFMQKQNDRCSSSITPKKNTPTKKETEKLTEQDVQMDDFEEDNDADDDPVTSSDMYGIQSDLIGRRSFGGFKNGVAKNWQESLQYLNGDGVSQKTTGKHVTDEELLQRYQAIVHGRSGRDNTKKRKKPNNSSNNHDAKKSRP